MTTSVKAGTALVALYTLLFFCNDAEARRIKKRADPPPLQTVQIPLTLNSDGIYGADVTMSPGAPHPQQFRFALTTSSGLTYVAGSNCTSCTSPSRYQQSDSISAKPLQGRQNVTIPGHAAQGSRIKEDCTLRTKNGSSWSYPNQTVIVADSSSFSNSSGISGLIGLGTNPGGNFSDTVFGGWLNNNPTRSNFSYGMQINRPLDTSSTDGGLLHWVVPDSTAYQGNVSWKAMVPRNTTADAVSSANASASTVNASGQVPNTDWTVEMDAFAFSAGSGSLSRNGLSSQAILDPYFPNIYVPKNISQVIYSSFSGTSVRSSASSINVYNVPCDQKLSLSVTFGQFTITVDEKTLVQKQSDGTCLGTIQEWADSSVNEFLFGSSFISNVYLIFTISSSQQSIGFARRSPPQEDSGLSKGAIVGIAVGSAAAAGLVTGCLVFFLVRRRYKTKTPESVKQLKTKNSHPSVSPFPSDPPGSARPLMAADSPPVSPDWAHLSYTTASSQYAADSSSRDRAHLDGAIPDTPPPYAQGGLLSAPRAPPQTVPPLRSKEMEAHEHSHSQDYSSVAM